MAYCTLSDIKKQISGDQLIQLSDDSQLGVVDTPTIDRAIADADAEIDSYLAARYATPLSPVPPLVLRLCVDISIYNLYSRRMGAPESRETRYKDATKLLKMLAMGTTTLGETPQRAEGNLGSPKSTNIPRFNTQGIGTTIGTMDNY